MKRKLTIICTFVLTLFLLTSGCENVQRKRASQTEVQKNNYNVLYWNEVKDVFDPSEYAADGYAGLTPEEALENSPDLRINSSIVEQKGEASISVLYRSWTAGSTEISYSEQLFYENDRLQSLDYRYEFYDAEDGKEFFIQLCERMMEITEQPFGGKMCEEDDEVPQSNYKEVPIEFIEEYLNNEKTGSYQYRYCIDLENRYYDFDPAKIKEDARWIEGLDDVKVIIIIIRNYSDLEQSMSNASAEVVISIER